MQSFIKMTVMQFKLFLREPVAFFFTLIFPAFLLMMWGLIWGNEPFEGTNFGFIDLQVPAASGIVVGTVALLSIPVTTATRREQRELRRFKATPMKPIVYIASDVMVNLLLAIISMIVLVILGRLVFGLRFGGNWLSVLAGFTLSALAFMAFGYILASVAPSPRVAQVVGNILYFPMMFLSGAAIPLDVMGDGMKRVAQLLPMTHMITLLQDLWFGNGWNVTAVSIMGIALLVGAAISSQVFRWE